MLEQCALSSIEVELCYYCKFCFIKRPYLPPHKFLIDIPKLVMRARAVEADKERADYLQREERDQALELSKRVCDLSEYLIKLNSQGRLSNE